MKKKKYKIIVLFWVGICLFTGCTFREESNPLSGKDTDERILMCLETTYPEHKFVVVKPFDELENSGIYADENGIEFEVHNMVYNNNLHFGCSDEYLSTILKREDYINKASQIAEKYGQELYYNEQVVSVDISIEDIESGKITLKEVAEMLHEILNCVKIPEVVVSESAGSFSTNEINYYCYPTWGKLGFSFECDDGTYATGGSISFSCREDTIDIIQEELEETYQRVLDYRNSNKK